MSQDATPKPRREKDWTLLSVHQQFGTQEACLEYVEALRWPNGPICPRCQADTCSRIETRSLWECSKCEYQFSATAGHPIFHRTRTPLPLWFQAIYLVCASKKGISAKQLQRDLGVTYKTAYRMGQQIRGAMSNLSARKLGGIVQADETYIGGKQRGHSWRNRQRAAVAPKKHSVAGIYEAETGEIRAKVVPDTTGKTLVGYLAKNVDFKEAEIHTDAYVSYSPLRKHGATHRTVNHYEAYVQDGVSTNGVENFWSLLKRGIIGQYHHVSGKHLQKYVDEFSYRFNRRHWPAKRMVRELI